MEDQRIAVIGGTGKFGQHLAEMLDELNEIVITGSTLEKAERVAEENGWQAAENTEAVQGADVVIVSVPIKHTVETIHEIGPYINSKALLCDVTSVKEKPCEAMEEYADEVLGMHPMYAPSNSSKGQKVVLCPVKGKKWTVFEEFWMEREADVHITDPEEHDKAMAVVQGLTHFTELVFAETMRKMSVNEEGADPFSTPVYQLVKDLTARMLNQKPELYHSIQKENLRNEEMRQEFEESARELHSLIGKDGFDGKFHELADLFDTDSAQDRTDGVIDYLTDEVR